MKTKFELASALFNNAVVALIASNGGVHRGKVTALAMEDGNGHCWNVTMRVASTGGSVTFFIRTIY